MSQHTVGRKSRDSSKMFTVLLTAVLLGLSSAQIPDEGTKDYWVGSGDIQEKERRKKGINDRHGLEGNRIIRFL